MSYTAGSHLCTQSIRELSGGGGRSGRCAGSAYPTREPPPPPYSNASQPNRRFFYRPAINLPSTTTGKRRSDTCILYLIGTHFVWVSPQHRSVSADSGASIVVAHHLVDIAAVNAQNNRYQSNQWSQGHVPNYVARNAVTARRPSSHNTRDLRV